MTAETITCTSWFTPTRRQCTNAAEDGHRWCQEHQDIVEEKAA